MHSIPFVKFQATGNDFIVVSSDDLAQIRAIGAKKRSARPDPLSTFARAILARHSGVGADGLLIISRAEGAKERARVRIINADGGEAEMSGNGIRCAAAWMLDSGAPTTTVTLETMAGVKIVEHVGDELGQRSFRVNMGEPILEPRSIPFGASGVSAPVVGYELTTSVGVMTVTLTSMGNPHCSIFVKSFDDLDWRAFGREIERHRLFPNRTNVEFVRVLSPGRIEVRFWERGVGETLSSGTGSSAAVVASILNGRTRRRVRVSTPGGDLRIEWAKSNQVFLSGLACRVASGTIEYEVMVRGSPL